MHERAGVTGEYGIDAPGVVRALGWTAAGTLVVTAVAAAINVLWLMGLFFGLTTLLGVAALWMTWSSRVGKVRERVRLVDRLELSGHERVLDVGCGRGLLLVETARRLSDGLAVGVDVWRGLDLSGNTPSAPLLNAEVEAVGDRVEVETGDARALPFATRSFDAVVSSMALHNISGGTQRALALREIDRVVRPGGRVALLDLRATLEYAAILRDAGWTDVERSGPVWRMFPPVRYVTATKPG